MIKYSFLVKREQKIRLNLDELFTAYRLYFCFNVMLQISFRFKTTQKLNSLLRETVHNYHNVQIFHYKNETCFLRENEQLPLSVKYRLIYRCSTRRKSFKKDSNMNFQECSPRTTCLLRSRHLHHHATGGEKHCLTPQVTVAKEATMTKASLNAVVRNPSQSSPMSTIRVVFCLNITIWVIFNFTNK